MLLRGIDGTVRDSGNFSKRYDWEAIQRYYDNEHSWRDVVKHFGVSNAAIHKAIKRGQFVTRNASDASALKLKRYGVPVMGIAARKRLSESQSVKNRGGKCKWYEVAGQKVQGTWERDFAILFEENSVRWYKPKIHRDVWKYVVDGVVKSYTPDFYLPDFDVYIELKGHWWGSDENKHHAVTEQNANKRLILIQKELFKKVKANFNELFKAIGRIA